MTVKHGAIGVGLLLFLDGRILTVKELRSKPEIKKEAGMVSFPLETLKDKDANPDGTIKRLLWEELGLLPNQVNFWGISPNKFNLFTERKDITTFYGVAKFLGNPGHLFIPKDDDIAIAGWKTPWELLSTEKSKVRIEVHPILNHFLSQID
ncbi:MAG: NUDIX hydrolase [Candidatus Moraniibacteriota bacterium]